MSEFKIGDRVRVLMNAGFSCGSVGTVTNAIDGSEFVLVMRDGSAGPVHFETGELELIHRPQLVATDSAPRHSHYFRPCPFDSIDVYRVLSIFGVTDACLQHAVKKLLVAGGRGHKDIGRDVQDAIDTLVRWQAMRAEEAA